MQTETTTHETPQGAREPRVRERTCAGCGKTAAPEDLVRVVLGPRDDRGASAVAVDLAGGTHGRGAHVHATKDCLAKAAKGGLAKSFKARVDVRAEELAEQIATACDRRIAGLLAGARRARLLAIGADAVRDACRAGEPLLVVACDAGSVVERGPIADAIAAGRAVAWKDKATLGALCGGPEVAVTAVMNEAVAAQIARTRQTLDSVGGRAMTARGEACRSREVR